MQRRPNVFDVGPTMYKCYTNVLCLLGSPKIKKQDQNVGPSGTVWKRLLMLNGITRLDMKGKTIERISEPLQKNQTIS